MEVFLITLLMSTVKKFNDAFKYVTNGDWVGLLTQAVAWGLGVLALVAAAHATGFQEIHIPQTHIVLGSLNGAAQIVLGLALGSGASVLLYDIPNHLDGTQPTANYRLVPGARRAPRTHTRDTRT